MWAKQLKDFLGCKKKKRVSSAIWKKHRGCEYNLLKSLLSSFLRKPWLQWKDSFNQI